MSPLTVGSPSSTTHLAYLRFCFLPTSLAITERVGALGQRRTSAGTGSLRPGRNIVDRLNTFVPSNSWDGPSTRSLSDAVIDAVGAAPDDFLDQLPEFLRAKPEYQYAIIAGFKKLWDVWDGRHRARLGTASGQTSSSFFEAILTNEEFWGNRVADEPVLSPYARLDSPGDRRIPQCGNPHGRKSLCAGAPAADAAARRNPPRQGGTTGEPRERDALNGAINTDKGKALEALINHALRRCRLSDRAAKLARRGMARA